MLDQGDFRPRNALLKLLDANGYHRYMAVDHVVAGLVPRDGRFTEVDVHPRSGIDDVDACRALDDVARELPARPSEPAFFYALPQNAHIAMATHRSAPAQQYPSGFFAPVAASVQQVDACLGRFIEFLRRQQLYDDSIVIVTSDHGDSLGEEGRWGHAYYMYPEVMRVPLIVHVPSWLAAGVRTDLDAVVFSTDLVPSLYALLGYAPADLGPLFGRPIFTPPDGDSSWRRRERFLLASSYGAVYGALSENGRRMFVVDAVGSRDDAFDLGDESRRVTITESMTAANRAFIARQLEALRAAYRYQP
jgi:phosphoglycerol transferase MdoB-like AlkP superfamily enzyme